MSEKVGLRGRWREYRPSKGMWFWSCLVSAALAIFVGFDWGGWVTRSTAEDMVEQARVELVGQECAARFENAPDAARQLAALRRTEIWKRDDVIVDDGWVTPVGATRPVTAAADACLHRLLADEIPLEASPGNPLERAVVSPRLAPVRPAG